MRKAFVIVFTLLCGSAPAPAMAQTDATQETTQPEKSAPRNIVSGILNDQKAIWTSPFYINRGEIEWLAPIGVGTAALFATDRQISGAAKSDTALRTPSNVISGIGNITPYAVPGAMWFLGAISHNDHATEAGRLSGEAELDTALVVEALKFATDRRRPNLSNDQSFPSGHAASAFALAAVLSNEYHDKPLIVFGSYGFATAVSLARIGGLNHFPSDVFVGAVIGELIGRYVVRHHAHALQQ
jgi:membrane-associated phospholipid phosphatase